METGNGAEVPQDAPHVRRSPEQVLEEALVLAKAGEMQDVCVIHRRPDGNISASWTVAVKGILAMFSVFMNRMAQAVMFGETPGMWGAGAKAAAGFKDPAKVADPTQPPSQEEEEQTP